MRTLLLTLCLMPFLLSAQLIDEEGEHGVDWGGYFFGLRGGLSLGSQDWSDIETELNPGLHGDIFYETLPVRSTFSFWASAGYHQRGSRLSRRRVLGFGGSSRVTLPADNFLFNNVVVALGGKQIVKYTRLADLYYLIGIRGEYNVSTNLSKYDDLVSVAGQFFRDTYPVDSYEFINRFTYGVTVGGGANFLLSESIGGFIELSAQPDLNFQYNQGAIANVIGPGPGNTTIGERAIRNFTIELSVGLRFLRKWTYVD